MKLTAERVAHPEKYTDPAQPAPELEDPRLYHYAIFSDNVLAASVVVNSAVKNSKDPSRHVFHVVTDRMNLGAMQVCKNLMHTSTVFFPNSIRKFVKLYNSEEGRIEEGESSPINPWP